MNGGPLKRRHCVTLIEVLIAIVLTVLILSTLMFFYRQVTEIGLEVDRANAKNFNLRYIEARLSNLLPAALKEKDKDFVFFSIGDEGLTKQGSQSLIFSFDNNVSLAKAFSGNSLARIYLDKHGNLMVAYWPSPKQWENNATPPMKKEMLYQGVDKLSFEFYIAPATNDAKDPEPKANDQKHPEKDDNKASQEKTRVEPEPKGEWRKLNWLEEYKQLPVMVKMILTPVKEKKEEPLIFIYPLTNAKGHIIYE